MTRESSKENNKPVGLKALFLLKPIRQWLVNRRSPDGHHHISTPVIQHPHNNGLSGTMDDLTAANHHRRSNNSSTSDNEHEQHFKRSAKNRMSLPIMQQNEFRRQAYSQLQIRGQQQARSMGHIYLQYKGETKQANLPNELTAADTIRALFVCAFPNMLSMEYMSQPHVKIYIYNPSCNIFYELRNIEDVRHESVLRIHQSDPMLALPPPPQPMALPAAAAQVQHYATMRLLPPIPQQHQLMLPMSISQPLQQHQQQQQLHHQQQQQQHNQFKQQQQPPLQRTPMQQQQPSQQQQQQQQQQHQHQNQIVNPHQISPHLQIPPPKPRRMIPALNGTINSLNGLQSMNNMNSLNGMNTSMNGVSSIYGQHNGTNGMNGLQSTPVNNHHVSSNNLIYMAAPPVRRTTPSPWLPPTQI